MKKTAGESGASKHNPTLGSIEGTFVRVSKAMGLPKHIELILRDGRYKEGTDEIYLEGTFTSRQIDATNWEVEVTHMGQFTGEKTTELIHVVGDCLVVKTKDRPDERVFKKIPENAA